MRGVVVEFSSLAAMQGFHDAQHIDNYRASVPTQLLRMIEAYYNKELRGKSLLKTHPI
jgi:hypothetical protein